LWTHKPRGKEIKERGEWKWSKWEGMDEMEMKGVSCKGQREKGEGGLGKRGLDGRRSKGGAKQTVSG